MEDDGLRKAALTDETTGKCVTSRDCTTPFEAPFLVHFPGSDCAGIDPRKT